MRISVVLREATLLELRGESVLRAGVEILLLAAAGADGYAALFRHSNPAPDEATSST